MGNYGLKIAKQGYDVASAEPKDLAFSSALTCAKIIQYGRVAGDVTSTSLSATAAFPLIIIAFIFVDADSRYHAYEVEYDSTNIYFSQYGSTSSDWIYYFVCYA